MAEKELWRVRRTFVEKVTKEIINQLLDHLLGDGVLNDGEKDSIIEENVSRADKARCLIDTVRRKGDEASRKMIAHIQNRDPTLYAQLATVSEEEQNWSFTLLPSDVLWTEDMKSEDEVISKTILIT